MSLLTGDIRMVAALRRRTSAGFVAAVLSCLFFATSGSFAKSLIVTGWSPAAVVTVRVAGAALLLLPLTLRAMHGRWRDLRGELSLVAAYGLFGVAAAQVGYFGAVARLDVAVALLLEYLGVILVVAWVWLRTWRAPHRSTLAGAVLAIAGLVLVLDLTGAVPPDVVGVLWGLLGAVGMAGHYILAAAPTRVPAVAYAGLGLAFGAAVLLCAGALGIVSMTAGTGPVLLGGAVLPAWVVFAELCLVAAAAAYLLSIVAARRLGSTLASFVGLSEVLFAVLIAWALLGETPGPGTVVGGALILGGVVAVRFGELWTRRQDDSAAGTDPGLPRRPRAVHAP